MHPSLTTTSMQRRLPLRLIRCSPSFLPLKRSPRSLLPLESLFWRSQQQLMHSWTDAYRVAVQSSLSLFPTSPKRVVADVSLRLTISKLPLPLSPKNGCTSAKLMGVANVSTEENISSATSGLSILMKNPSNARTLNAENSSTGTTTFFSTSKFIKKPKLGAGRKRHRMRRTLALLRLPGLPLKCVSSSRLARKRRDLLRWLDLAPSMTTSRISTQVTSTPAPSSLLQRTCALLRTWPFRRSGRSCRSHPLSIMQSCLRLLSSGTGQTTLCRTS